MRGAIGVLLANDPARFAERGGDCSAVRAWDTDGTEMSDTPANWLVDRLAGFWWSNISGYTLNISHLSSRQDVKDDAFLCSRLNTIIDELGLADEPKQQQALVLSRLLNRVLHKAQEALGTELLTPDRSFPIAIRKKFFRPFGRVGMLSPAVKLALEEAIQGSTFAGRASFRDGKTFVLRNNRAHYAARLMSHRVPYGEWVEIDPPQDPQQAVHWARNLLEGRPLLINCEVTFRGPRAHDLSLLANMGSGAAAVMGNRGRRANLRSWVAGPEFLALSQLADIRIRGVLAADRYVANPWAGFSALSDVGPDGALPLPCGPLLLRGRSAVDYDMGLVAECCAFALTSQEAADSISAWITSHDRAAMLSTCAELLHSFSPDTFAIAGFSRGRVWVRIPTDDVDLEEVYARVAEISEAGRLVPPVLPKPGPASVRRIEIGKRVSGAVTAGKDLELLPAVAAILGSRGTALGA